MVGNTTHLITQPSANEDQFANFTTVTTRKSQAPPARGSIRPYNDRGSLRPFDDRKFRGFSLRGGTQLIGAKHNIMSIQATKTPICKTSGFTRDDLRPGMIITAPMHVSNTDRFATVGENLKETCCGGVISKRRPMIVMLLGPDSLLAGGTTY